jgi:DNA-binding transcriptional MerR regulator
MTNDGDSGRNGLGIKKLYYSIGEVTERTGIAAHVLRYWENEFDELRPKKGRGGNRLYQDKDLQLIEQIRDLLYDKKFTISGARVQLKQLRKANGSASNSEFIETVKRELREILDLLK